MQKFDSKMMKHLEDGGLVEHVGTTGNRTTYGLHEVLCSAWRDDAVWEYKAEPKYVWTRVRITADGTEFEYPWFTSKELFMEGRPAGTKFGPWRRRLETEVCDD